MGIEQKTRFALDKSKCIQCGRYVNTCSGSAIHYEPEAMHFFTVKGKRFCSQQLTGIVCKITDAEIEHFHLGVNPIFREC